MNRKTLALAALAASSALALSACGTDTYVEELKSAAEDPAPVPEETPEADAEPAEATIGEQESPLLAFGEAAVYDDGLEVTADVVATVAVSDVASTTCEVGDPVTVVELTVVNGTDARINPWEDFLGSLEAEYVNSTGYAVTADGVFDTAGYGHDYELSGGQDFATLRPGQTGSDVYGFCVEDMEPGSLYLSLDPTTFDEPGYKDLVEWTENGEW